MFLCLPEKMKKYFHLAVSAIVVFANAGNVWGSPLPRPLPFFNLGKLAGDVINLPVQLAKGAADKVAKDAVKFSSHLLEAAEKPAVEITGAAAEYGKELAAVIAAEAASAAIAQLMGNAGLQGIPSGISAGPLAAIQALQPAEHPDGSMPSIEEEMLLGLLMG